MFFLFDLVWRILKNKFRPPSNPTHLKFTSKTVIVTGANTGLGYEAALKFAIQNCARLILAVRNVSAGDRAQRVIQHLASDPRCKVEVWEIDMADYGSVDRFVERVGRECERVDVAVLNAGVWRSEFRSGGYEREETVLVNCLATVWLGMCLRTVMAEKWRAQMQEARNAEEPTSSEGKGLEKPVLEFVSSGRYARPGLVTPEQIDSDDSNILDAYNTSKGYSAGKQYAASKLFLMCAVIQLARDALGVGSDVDGRPSGIDDIPSDTPVRIVSVCPGACQSSLSRDLDGLGIRIARFYANMLFLRTAEEGARTLVSGTALGDRGHGRFWQNDEVKPIAPILDGECGAKFRRKVWHEISQALRRDVKCDVQDTLYLSDNIKAL